MGEVDSFPGVYEKLPKISFDDLCGTVITRGFMEHSRRFHLGRKGYERCLRVAELLARESRPVSFTELRRRLKWNSLFRTANAHSVNVAINRCLKFLRQIDVARQWDDGLDRGYYLAYQALFPGEKREEPPRSMAVEWMRTREEIDQVREEMKDVKGLLEKYGEALLRLLEKQDNPNKGKTGVIPGPVARGSNIPDNAHSTTA